jgi:molybdenum cofactor cytidylyltransferase
MGTSIRAGIAAVGAVDAVMIFLCDQPLVTAGSLDDLVASHFRSNKPISAATYGGTAGTPVIFASDLFPELLALGNAEGGKAIIQRYPEKLNLFPLSPAEADVDTPEDFNRICRDHEQI